MVIDSRFRQIIYCIVLVMMWQSGLSAQETGLLNLSFDNSREYYIEIDEIFAKEWLEKTGEYIPIKTTHAGSLNQAKAIIEGAHADIVTLASEMSVDMISEHTKLIPSDWKRKFPHNSSPFSSSIVFLVRKGNPKGVKDWDDISSKDVSIVMPDPKTSALAKYNYLSAWAYYDRKFKGDEQKILTALQDIPRKILPRRKGSRTTSLDFLQRGLGDVSVMFESEALLAISEFGDKFEIVYPSVSFLAPFPVAIVEGNVMPKGKGDLANAYVNFLFSPKGQAVAAKHFFHPAFEQYARASDMRKLPKISYLNGSVHGGGVISSALPV